MAVEIEEVGKKLKNPYIIGAIVGGGAILLFMALSRKQQTESVEDVYLESYPTPEMTYPKGGGEANIMPDLTAILSEMQRLQAEQNLVIGELFASTMADIMEGFSSISQQMVQQMQEISRATSYGMKEMSQAVAKLAEKRHEESQMTAELFATTMANITEGILNILQTHKENEQKAQPKTETKPVVITTRAGKARNIPLRDYFEASGYKVEYLEDSKHIRVYDPETGHSAMLSKDFYDVEKNKAYISEDMVKRIEQTIKEGKYKLPGY